MQEEVRRTPTRTANFNLRKLKIAKTAKAANIWKTFQVSKKESKRGLGGAQQQLRIFTKTAKSAKTSNYCKFRTANFTKTAKSAKTSKNRKIS